MADNEDDLVSEVTDEQDEQQEGEEEEKEPVAEDDQPTQVVDEEKAVENEIEVEAQVLDTEEEQAPQQEPETRDDAEEKQNEEETIEPEEKPAGEQVEAREPDKDDEILQSDFEFEREKTENELSESEDGEQPEIDDKRVEGEQVKEDEQETKDVIWEEEEGITEMDQLAVDEPAPDDVSVIESDLPQEAEPLDLSFHEADELDIPAPDVSNLEPTSPEPLAEENQESKGDIRRSLRLSGDQPVVDADHPISLRAQFLDKYEEVLATRELLKLRNMYLQNKLADYFRKNKTDEASDGDKSITDHEQRYLKYMAQLEEVKAKYAAKEDSYKSQIEDIKTRSQNRKEMADKERIRFTEFKKGVALKAIFAYNGKPVVAKDIEQYLSNELKKEEEVRNNRLENIKLKHKLKKKEHELKTKEELVEGLHLIDFEQLKIENQTYNEKIEERNEELLKLRKKVTGTVQILTHVKEKLQFVQARNLVQSAEVKEVEALVGQKRDILSRTKQARDALRIDNNKLRQKCGFLGNPSLLMDFENQKFEGSHLQSRLDELKMTHADLTVSCQHIQKKIEQANNSLLSLNSRTI